MKSRDIICITMTTWEGDYMKTIVHMMKQLSKHHRVLFVDYPFTYKDFAFSLIGRSPAPAKRMLGLNQRMRQLGPSLYHLTLPPVLPINWISNFKIFKQASVLQGGIISHAINKASNKLNFDNPLVINAFNPLIGLPLFDKLNASETIYYCYDEIGAASWCGKHGDRMENEFIAQVDRVITTSSNLYLTKIKKNRNTFLVRNGVDYDLFRGGANQQRFSKSSKTIGYLGSVDSRLDYDLLEEVIKAYPEHSFKFVGRITYPKGKERLNKFNNVIFTGSRQPDQIPAELKTFDLGLIPFVSNKFTRNIYPLKINEYLAAGIPVVSTHFADLSDFESQISIANNSEQFCKKIELEINSDSWGKSLQRFEVALANDWSSRASEVNDIIEKLTPARHA